MGETHQWRTLSTTCITRLMSSFALLRVSARTDRDIMILFPSFYIYLNRFRKITNNTVPAAFDYIVFLIEKTSGLRLCDSLLRVERFSSMRC